MKKPYYLHWFIVSPFNRIVVLVVGDYKASFKECNRRFIEAHLPPKKRTPFSDGIDEILGENPPTGCPEICGRCVKKGINVFVWFPTFPTPGTLAHELMHAKDYILNSAGVTDTSGETDAYLLGEMYDHFFSVIEKDKAQEKDK
jgi:hypothetical protein